MKVVIFDVILFICNFQNSKERYQKKILGERIARLCGAIAVIQVIRCHNYF
jgi:chaperonin GroEL